MSTRSAILAAVRTRLQAIARTDGFATDAGAALYLGERPELGPDDPDEAIAIVVRDDAPKAQGHKLFITLPVSICAIAKADLDDPWQSIEDLLADIKVAFELDDMTLGGLLRGPMERGATRTLDREPGSLTIGAQVSYFLPYHETWGHP